MARVQQLVAGAAITAGPTAVYTVPAGQHALLRTFSCFRPGGVSGAVPVGLYLGGTGQQQEAIFLNVGTSSWVSSPNGWGLIAEAGATIYMGHGASVDTLFYGWLSGTLYVG